MERNPAAPQRGSNGPTFGQTQYHVVQIDQRATRRACVKNCFLVFFGCGRSIFMVIRNEKV